MQMSFWQGTHAKRLLRLSVANTLSGCGFSVPEKERGRKQEQEAGAGGRGRRQEQEAGEAGGRRQGQEAGAGAGGRRQEAVCSDWSLVFGLWAYDFTLSAIASCKSKTKDRRTKTNRATDHGPLTTDH
ncbi:MAG: hypothetical protein ACREBG_09120 [Pyrinomonadaceae bacterium]